MSTPASHGKEGDEGDNNVNKTHSHQGSPDESGRKRPGSKSKGGRCGSPHYTNEDITGLLVAVKDVHSLGSNDWALVHKKFSEWASSNEPPLRDQDPLKMKFDQLANTKKKTGDPSCPPHVRRAKHIARDILNKCSALCIEGESSSEEIIEHYSNEQGSSDEKSEAKNDDYKFSSTSDRRSTEKIHGNAQNDGEVGERKKKRKRSATGISSAKRRRGDLIDHVGRMADHVGAIAQSCMLSSSNCSHADGGQSGGAYRTEIVNIVREELKPTNNMISNIKSLLETLASKFNSSEQ